MPTKKKTSALTNLKGVPATIALSMLSGDERHENVDPAVLLLGQNVRFALTRVGIDKMKADIISIGKVETPIVVEDLSDEDKAANPGKLYRVVKGNYRTTAAQELNSGDSAGLTVPVTVTSFSNALQRITRQVAENVIREQMNPMDEAVAIQLLIDNGATKQDVMQMFARSKGRRNKAGKMQVVLEAASNSFINMRLSYLELPKVAQTALAEGRLGVKGAYELTKYTGEELKKVLSVLVEKWEKEEEAQDREEDKFLVGQTKLIAQAQKAEDAVKKLKDAGDLVMALTKETEAAAITLQETFKAKVVLAGAKDKKDDQKKAEEAFKAADNHNNNVKASLAKAKETLQKVQKAQEVKTPLPAPVVQPTSAAGVAEAARRTGAVQAPVTTRSKGRGQGTTTAADAASGSQPVKLNAQQMRFYVDSLVKLAFTGQPKTKAIGESILKAFDGVDTDGQMYETIARIVGEWKK